MRLSCRLRHLRGERGLREVAELVGVHAGQLSEIERGIKLPRDDQVDRMETVYGPAEEWYSKKTLLVLNEDEAE